MTGNNNYHTDDGDLLLEQFFQKARMEQLPDDGFTHRVMMRLPARQQHLSQIWTVACIITALTIFTFIGGWHQVASGIVRVLSSAYTPMQLLQLMFCGAVITILAATELMRQEKFNLYG